MKKLLHFITILLITHILFFSCTIGLGESVDTEVPSIKILSPDPYEVLSICNDFLIKGTWNDDGTINSVIVTLKQDKSGKEWSYEASFDEVEKKEHVWRCMIPAVSEKIPDGPYLLSVKITDVSGRKSTATSQIVIDNTPPLIALSRPSSASDDTEIDSYGQTLTLNGEAADDSGVASIQLDVYSSDDIENPENKLHTVTMSNIINNINRTVAQFEEGNESNDYYKIYQESSISNAIDKSFYCTITAWDGAVSFPSDGSGPVKTGNATSTYYLHDSISSLLKTYKSTGLYHILAGTYEEDISTEDIELDLYKVNLGKFSLNPTNNPKFNISDRFRITENGLNAETAKVKDGETIVVEIVSGLDGIDIDPATLKVFTLQCDEGGNILDAEKKYPESSEPKAQDPKKANLYKITSLISRNDYNYNSFYLIGVEGKDIQGNPVLAYAPNGYGFVFVSSGLLPTVTVETPADGAVIKKGADVEVQGTIYYLEEGEFSIKLNGEPLFNVTEESNILPENLSAGQLSYIKDEHIEGLFNFKYIIPADKFNQNRTDDYTLSFPDKDDTQTVSYGSADRTIKYDVEEPDVILNFSGNAEDNELLGPLAHKYDENGQRADEKEYLNGKFAFESKLLDNVGIDLTKSKIQIIEKRADGSERIRQNLTVNSEYQTFKDIDTLSFTAGSSLIVRATIYDIAGNVITKEESYEVDQSTDEPLICPVTDALSESTATVNLALDTKAKVGAQKDYNIVSADSPSIKLKFIDDDCIVEKNPVLNYKYWKDGDSKPTNSEKKEFTNNEFENIEEFIIEDAKTDYYFFEFELSDGVDSDKTITKTVCIRVAPRAPSVKLEDVTVEYVTNASVVNKTADAKVSLKNKIIINSTEAPFKLTCQVIKLDEEENASVVLPFKNFDELEDATVTDNSAVDGTYIYDTPFEIPADFENGKYQITYKVFDKSKQSTEDSVTDAVTFYVDKTPEEITDVETSASDTIPFVLTFTKNGEAPVEYYWAFTEKGSDIPVYGAPLYKKTTSVNNKVKLNELFIKEGEKTVHVYAVDRAGNRSNIKSKDFIYDTAKPAAELIEKNFTTKDNFELNVKASDSWGIKQLELWQKKSTGPEKVAEKSYTDSQTEVTATNWKIENLPREIPEEFFAKNEYFVKAIDLADKSFETESIIVTVDNKKPVCTFTTADKAVLKGSLGIISGTASDGASEAEGSGLEKLYYTLSKINSDGSSTLVSEAEIELSGAINSTWEISKTLGTGNELEEGSYKLSLYAKDLAGNKGEPKTLNFFVDFAAPLVTSAKTGSLDLEKNKAVYIKTDSTISITGTIQETNGIESVTVNDQPASFELAEENSGDGRHTFSISGLELSEDNKDIPLVITVKDKAGLESTNNYIVHNDKKAPLPVFSKPTIALGGELKGENSLYDSAYKFIGSFNDEDGSGAVSYKYKISTSRLAASADGTYNTNGWTSASGKDFSIEKNLSTEGLYYLYFYVEDKVGNASTKYISYWVDKNLPEITSLDEIKATGQNINGIPVVNSGFKIKGSASDGNKIDYVEIKEKIGESENLIQKFENSSGQEPFEFTRDFVLTGENAVSDGKHTYIITAVDKAGRVSASSTKEVRVDTKLPAAPLPQVSSPANPAYTSSTGTNPVKWYKTADITFTVTAVDTDAGSGIFQVMASSKTSEESSWVMFTSSDGNSWSGVVNCSKQGLNEVTFRAIDNAGNQITATYPVYIDTESPVSAAIDSFYVGQVQITDFSNKILVNGTKEAIVSLAAQDFYADGDTQKVTGSGIKEITAKIGSQDIDGVTSSYDSTNNKWTLTIPGAKLNSGTLAFDIKDNVKNAPWEYTSDVIFEFDNKAPDIASINEVKDAYIASSKKDVNKTFTLTGKAHDTNRLLSVELQYKKHVDEQQNDEQWKTYTTIYENLTSWSIDVDTTEKDAEEKLLFEDKTVYDFQIIVSDTAQNTKTSAPVSVYVNQDSDIPVLTFKDMSLAGMTSASPAESETNDIRINVFDDDGKIKSLEYRIGDAGDWTAAEFLNSSYIVKLPDGTYDGSSSHNPVINFRVVDAKDGEFTSPKLKGKDNSSTEETVLYVCVDTTAPYIQALNISRTGNTDDWINATVFTETLGGDNLHNSFYLSINTYDANKVESVKYELKKGDDGVREGDMSPVGEPSKKADGFFYYQFKTSVPVSVGELLNNVDNPDDDVEALSSGQYTLVVTVSDKQENGKERQTSKTLMVDNTPPDVLVHEHNDPNHIELIGSAFTLQGSFNDGDLGTTLKYQVTDSSDTENLNDDAWVDVAGVSSAYWKIYFDSKENGIEGGYTHGKLPKYLIADARSDLIIDNEIVVYQANNQPFEEPLKCYFHLRGADSYGNYSIYSLPLKLDPLGEIPDIYLDSPEIQANVSVANSKLMSGIIRLSGHVNAVKSIKRADESSKSGVYIQIDPSFNGTFAADWNSQTLPNGKTFAEAGYTIVDFGPDDKQKKGIYVGDNLSWAFQLNKKSEFEKADGTSKIAVRLFVVDDQNNVSRSDDVVYVMQVNAGVPRIGSSEELKLYRYGWSDSNGNLVGYTKTGPDENGRLEDNTPLYDINDPVCERSQIRTWNSSLIYTPSIKDYKENMFLKGKWFLTGSVEDEDHISLFTINDIDAKSATEIEWISEGNKKTYGYRIHHIVGDDEADSCKVLTYKLSAKDGTSGTAENDKHEKEENIIIRVDNKGPEVAQETSENYGISKAILNKDGFYKIKSAATEAGNESGFLRTVFFFANGTSSVGTSGTVYDSYIKNTKTYSEAPDNVLNCSSLKYEDGLYWKTRSITEIDKSARKIKLSAADDNLHTGGLVKLGGIIYTVTKLEDSGTILTLDGAPDLGWKESSTNTAPVYIAIGHVVDHFGLEAGGTEKNDAGYYTNISGDDGDCMMESVNTTGTTTRWEASINSQNLRDGAVELHYVVFDKAGNYTEKIINDAVVKNNAPRLASLKLWTDYNGNGKEDEGEHKTYYHSAKTRTFKENGKEYKEERATAFTDHLNVYGENGGAFMTIKGDDVTFTPEVIGGNGALYYSNAEETAQDNRNPFLNDNGQPIIGTDSINGKYTEDDENGQSYIKGQTMSFVLSKENLGNNSDLREFNYWIWDSTIGTKQLNSKMTVALKILNSTTEKPKVEYFPFYWNSKDDNSLFENKRENGHIELVEALPTDTFRTGNSGIYDRDPKVSGKITVRGYVRDDIRLKQIKLQVPDFSGLISEVLVAEYKIENGTAYWTGTDKMNDEHWKFSVTKDTNDGDGHKAEWEFSWDTSYIDDITKENAQVIVSAVAGKEGETERVSDATYFQMDIVPYITKVRTPLYDTASDNYRSALGHYPVKPGDKLELYGFNLEQGKGNQGKITVNVGNDWKSGKLNSVTASEKTYNFINSLNDNDAIGEYPLTDEDKEKLTSSEGKDIYENLYNRQPDGVTNNTLTDDIYLDIWDFKPEAVKPVKGHIDQPIMKINPATGIIGFAFADGSTYFSMGGSVKDEYNGDSDKVDYSYNYWLGAYDSFTSIGFAYDKWGYSYGVAAGGDINDSNSYDKVSFMMSRWGVCCKFADASKNTPDNKYKDKQGNNNKIRIERISQAPNSGNVIVNKQRVQSPSIATTAYKKDNEEYTNVYLAYFDDINKEIRFRSGSTNSTGYAKPSDPVKSFDMFGDDCSGNNGVKYNSNGDTVQKVNIVAGANTGRTAGKYVSISAIPKDKIDGATEDTVVIVWYDEDSKTLWYGYNKTPISSAKGVNSGSEWTVSRVFTDPSQSYYQAGANCQIIADELGGVHIAAYDEDNGHLIYAYKAAADTGNFTTCIVDSCGVVGSNLSLDIALNEAGTVAVPRIGYYDISNGYPKYAYLVSEDTDKLTGAENNMFTGNWECTIVPTTSNVSLDNSKQTNLINVGVWKDKDTGKIKNSTKGTNSQVNQFNGYSSKSYGSVYGNGSKNAVLGYLVAKDSSNDTIETAQIKPTSTGD